MKPDLIHERTCAELQAERDTLRALLRDCLGPLRVALSEFEENDRLAPKFSSLLKRIDVVLEGRDG